MSRRKGKSGELEVVHVFGDAGLPAYRSAALQAGEVEGAGDVTVRDFPELHVEVKRTETYSLPAWQRQADAGAGEWGKPIVCYRRSGAPKTPEPWRAIVRLPWLAGILAELRELRVRVRELEDYRASIARAETVRLQANAEGYQG